jgi:hypothetical protein
MPPSPKSKTGLRGRASEEGSPQYSTKISVMPPFPLESKRAEMLDRPDDGVSIEEDVCTIAAEVEGEAARQQI